jgi:hypothetical protein
MKMAVLLKVCHFLLDLLLKTSPANSHIPDIVGKGWTFAAPRTDAIHKKSPGFGE